MTAPLRVVTVTVEELAELLEAAVRRALEAAALTSTSPAASSEWMNATTAAALLAVNRRTVIKLAVSGKLPGSGVGRGWRFRRGDVEALLMSRQPPVRRSA